MLTHILLTVVIKTNKNLFSSECLFGGIPTDADIKLLSVIDASPAVYMHTLTKFFFFFASINPSLVFLHGVLF